MKILYDHQIFEMQKIGGISRYFCEIIKRLGKSGAITVNLALKYSQNEYIRNSAFDKQAEADPYSYENFLGGREFRGKWSLYELRNRLRRPIDPRAVNKDISIAALQKQDFDVFHPTYYDDYFLPHIGTKPFVLTVYDMIHEIYPEYFSLADLTSERKRKLAQKASKIIAISEHTKKDLVQFCNVAAEKIEVVHLANSMDSHFDSMKRPLALPGRYILFVGSRSVYKNFFFFINSVRSILQADPALNIVCAGSSFSKNEQDFFDQHGLTGRIHCHSVSDTELGLLYKKAIVFIFPSLYEGFGLPVLEAFGSNCPVILSNAGSLPEVGGDGAMYFEPKDAQSLRTAITAVLYGESTRAELIENGNRRLQLFSWDKTCRATELVYREVLTMDKTYT